MQTAVIARAILCVCLSVCLSVTFWCFILTNEDTIVRFSASGRTMILVSDEVFTHSDGVYVKRPRQQNSENLTNKKL